MGGTSASSGGVRHRLDRMALRRLSIGVAIGTIGVALLIATATIPLVLHTFADISWSELSDIGQAYGGFAATLATLSLSALAISVFLQARDTRTAQEHGARLLHLELVRMSLEDPTLLGKFGRWSRELPEDEIRYHVNQNLWLMLWRTLHRLGYIGERELRLTLASELFDNTLGRRFWMRSREIQLASIQNHRDRRFYDIVEDEFQKLPAHARSDERISAYRPTRPIWRTKRFLLGASGVLGAISTYMICRSHGSIWIEPQRPPPLPNSAKEADPVIQ